MLFRRKHIQDKQDVVTGNQLLVKDAATFFKMDLSNFRRALKRTTGQYPKPTASISLTDACVASTSTHEGSKALRDMITNGRIGVTLN